MANLNTTEITAEVKAMTDKLTGYHAEISGIMKTHKSRSLATCESAIRNSVDHLDRLREALPKVGSTKQTGQKARPSRLSKPETVQPKSAAK